jgi:hypothetical protein
LRELETLPFEANILLQGRQFDIKKTNFRGNSSFLKQIICDYLLASAIATATATLIQTMGLLPAPIKPIISTYRKKQSPF